jgi:ribosomal protein S18 acetylase RimI-like enzyme
MAVRVESMGESNIRAVKSIEIECGLSRWPEADYLKEINRPEAITLVAIDGEQVVGFLCARLIISNQNQPENHPKNKHQSASMKLKERLINPYQEAEIYNLAVKQAHRRQKIAKRLLKSLYNMAAQYQIDVIWLEVRQSNLAALNFYRQEGFVEVALRKGLYAQPPEDGILMKKNCESLRREVF